MTATPRTIADLPALLGYIAEERARMVDLDIEVDAIRIRLSSDTAALLSPPRLLPDEVPEQIIGEGDHVNVFGIPVEIVESMDVGAVVIEEAE